MGYCIKHGFKGGKELLEHQPEDKRIKRYRCKECGLVWSEVESPDEHKKRVEAIVDAQRAKK
jgi:uncharacterized Zn finger protein